jgi:endonuclease YncB( thermonuclease family)
MIFHISIKRDLIKTILPIVFFLFLPISSFASQFEVMKVYDGDTIRVKGYGAEIKLRLAGIDAPETSKKRTGLGQRYSQEAKEHLAGLILNKAIEIDGYGYLKGDLMLGVVFLDGKNINLEMVRAGLAEVYLEEPPNELNLDPFFKAERQSRAEKMGIWIQGDGYVSPRTWRERQRVKSACAVILFGICEQGEK